MQNSRRNCLSAAGGAALLAAGLFGRPAQASGDSRRHRDLLYGHGMVWNRELPGERGLLRLSFDLRVSLSAGTGLGTAVDPVYSSWNLHFALDDVRGEARPGGEMIYLLSGKVTAAADPEKVGLPVRIAAETSGDTTAVVIRLGESVLSGAGLVVIGEGQVQENIIIRLIRIILGR